MDRGNLLSRDMVLQRGAAYGLRCVPALAGCVLAAVALLLAARRCGGALSEPLGSLPLASVGLLAAVSAALVRAAGSTARRRRPGDAGAWLWGAGPMALVALLGWAVSLPGSPGLGLGLLWGVLAAEEAWTLRGWLLHDAVRWYPADAVRADAQRAGAQRTGAVRAGAAAAAEVASASGAPVGAGAVEVPPMDVASADVRLTDVRLAGAPADVAAADAARADVAPANVVAAEGAADAGEDGAAGDAGGDAADVELPSPWDADVEQLLVRRRDPELGDVLHGWVRARFAPRQQRASVHVAFCPPFAAVPLVECEALDEPAVRVSVGQCFAYGARLDVYCPAASGTEESAVLLELFVRSDWHAPPAAG